MNVHRNYIFKIKFKMYGKSKYYSKKLKMQNNVIYY